MSMPLIRILVLSCLMTIAGCAARQKNTSRIYEGDAPNIKFLGKRESAGGPVGGR